MDISLPVTLAVLGAALLHASWNVLLKSGDDKELETISIAVGSGLVGLADRVEALGGRLHIESTPGRGTQLTAEIPC